MRFFYFLFLLIGSLSAQNYLWPTNASNYLSSSFCEYRPGHYHAAIDIKTWNREGYPCYAVADGKIEHIRISPFGAGKALYIRLNDGNTTAYFHLQHFTKQLDNIIREKQIAEKSFSVDVWLKDFYVKKGEIVAYSGQTGIGVPHLHFEVRDEKNTPMNPLQFYPQVKDNIRPKLDEILVIPQNAHSHVNGTFIPQSFPLNYINNGVYEVSQPVYVYGKAGLAFKGFDQADGVSNKLTFYSSELWIDGQQVFQQAYDKIPFRDTRMVDIDIYYPEKSRSGKRFNKLFIEPFNTLDFYNRTYGDGLISVMDSSRQFEIRVKDYFGNTSIVKGKLVKAMANSVQLDRASVLNKSAYLKLWLPKKIRRLEFFTGPEVFNLKAVEYFEIIEKVPADSGMQALVKLRLPDAADRYIKSVVENESGIVNSTMAAIDPDAGFKIHPQIRLAGKYLYFHFPGLQDSESMRIHINQQDNSFSDRIRFTETGAEYVLPANKIFSENLNVIINDSGNVHLDTLLSLGMMLPGENQSFSFYSDSLILTTQIESVYDTLLFRVQKIPVVNENAQLPVFGDAYKIDAGDEIMNRGVSISLKSDSQFFSDGKAAIYSMKEDEFHYSGGEADYANYIKDRVKSFRTFIVAADTIAPVVTVESPKNGKTYNKTPLISFKAEDTISGIGSDGNITVYFDDQFVVPEWDPERDLVKSDVHFTPEKGNHTVTITVKDQAGNQTQKMIHFIMK